MNTSDYSRALSCLEEFARTYKDENGVMTVGNIRDLINHIDLIKDCVNKRRCIPTKNKMHFKLFGYSEWVKYCGSCGSRVYSEQGGYCPKCGQRFC